MKRLSTLLILLALILSILPSPTFAESETAYNFVIDQGYSIVEKFESPGWRTCYLIENADSQSLTFSDETDAYIVMALPMLDVNFDKTDMRALFLDLVRNFEWKVSFWQPDSYNETQFALSYGITKDIDKTKQNFDNISAYCSALEDRFTDEAVTEALTSSTSGSMHTDEEWQALYDKIDSWNTPEIESTCITECVHQIVGTRPLSLVELSSDISSCAQFYIGDSFVLAGPGGSNASLAKFLHPDLGQWSYAERWGIAGSIFQHLRDNASAVLAEGLKSSVGDVDTTAVICIYDDPYIYVSIYDLIFSEITTTVVE